VVAVNGIWLKPNQRLTARVLTGGWVIYLWDESRTLHSDRQPWLRYHPSDLSPAGSALNVRATFSPTALLLLYHPELQTHWREADAHLTRAERMRGSWPLDCRSALRARRHCWVPLKTRSTILRVR